MNLWFSPWSKPHSQSCIYLPYSCILTHSLACSAYACIPLDSLAFSGIFAFFCILWNTLAEPCILLHSVAYSWILLHSFVLHTLAYIQLWYLYALVDCTGHMNLYCLGLLSCFDKSLSCSYSIIKDHFSHISTRYVNIFCIVTF